MAMQIRIYMVTLRSSSISIYLHIFSLTLIFTLTLMLTLTITLTIKLVIPDHNQYIDTYIS